MKLDALMKELTENHVLGRVIAYSISIESQNRGPLHAHILLICDDSAKRTEPSEFDEVISAEIPDKKTHPHLHEVIVRHNIHKHSTHCGGVKGDCRYEFPKPYGKFCMSLQRSDVTTMHQIKTCPFVTTPL